MSSSSTPGVSIELRGVAVSVPGDTRGGATILGPLDLALDAGSYTCVLGASGSGKSTLLRAIAGLATPSAGSVLLGGSEASAAGKVLLAPEHRGIGMLFQEGALWPHLSVARNIAFGLRKLSKAERRDRVAELLEQVRLPGYEDRMPATLSGGEAQRVALARALAPRPGVLLLDEPLGPLDARLRGELCDALGQLHAQGGFTCLHVTHDRSEPERLDAPIRVLADGHWTDDVPA